MARGSPWRGRAVPRVTTRPSCSQLVSTMTSVVCPATKLGPRPIVRGAKPRCTSGRWRFRIRVSISTSGAISPRTAVKSPTTTGTAILRAKIAGTTSSSSLDVAESADQHAQRHEPTSARIVSFRSSPWWPVVALALFCPWTEHQEARCEEQQSDEHDAPTPHGQSDDSRVEGWLIGDPWRLRAAGRAHLGVARDQFRAESAGDGLRHSFGHAATPSILCLVIGLPLRLGEGVDRFLVAALRATTMSRTHRATAAGVRR